MSFSVRAMTVKSTPKTIVCVSAERVNKFQEDANRARGFLNTYLGEVRSPTLKDYDEAFTRWQKSSDRRYSESEVINILGSYLGETLINDFQMEWVAVSDELGKSYAVRHRSLELISYPFSSVEKRIDSGTSGFLWNIYYTVKDGLDSGAYRKRKN